MSFSSVSWSELSLQIILTFGHFLWQACIVAIVLVIVEQLSSMVSHRFLIGLSRNPSTQHAPRSSANFRYTTACVAFFSLPVCVVTTFLFVLQSRQPIGLTASVPTKSLVIPISNADERGLPTVGSDTSKLIPQEMPTEAELSLTKPSGVPSPAVSAPLPKYYLESMAPYLLIAYSIGVGLMLTRFGLSIAGSSRLRRTLPPTADSNLTKIIAEQSSWLGLKRVPIVALCQRVSVPVVVGIMKPMILLPPAIVCGLDPNQFAAILSHELAHIRRYDLVVNLLQRVVEALLFFHPVTWWISRRMSVEREICCDDIAATACMGRLSYASALLQMAELCIASKQRRLPTLATLSADGGNKSDFGYRIRRLIDAEGTSRIGVTWRGFVVGLTILSLLIISLFALRRSQQANDERLEAEATANIVKPEPKRQMELPADEVALEEDPSLAATNKTIDELSEKRKGLVQQIEIAVAQRDKAKEGSDEFHGLDYQTEIKEWKLAKFDLENGVADIVLPDVPQATPEHIAELREMLRIRWGRSVDGVQIGIGRLDDRDRFAQSAKIPFQIYIRNSTQEPIVHRLRWFDAANMSVSLRALASVTSENNLFLSPRSGSPILESTEVKLDPGLTHELPLGRFEMDTTGLHPGVYSIDANFPVVFPPRESELATRVARPIESDFSYELLLRFQLTGEQLPPDIEPSSPLNQGAEISAILWGTPVYGLQAGTRFRGEAVAAQETNSATAGLRNSTAKQTWHFGDTIKTEILVRNISSQPITVRFHPSVGEEIRLLGAMESGLTDLSSRAIMRRSNVPIALDSERTIEKTLKPGELFIAAHQDFEIQQLVDGRERLLELPEANRHWVPGVGDYAYSAYLGLGITDSLSVSLHSGRIKIQIGETIEARASSLGEPHMNDDLNKISALIASGKQIPREVNDMYQSVHRKLTPAERLKSIKLFAVPEFVMQVLLSEPTYALEEKVALLSELRNLNFENVEFGLQEWLANVATEFAQVDPAATREWLGMFRGAEYGVGMGLTAVLETAKQKDPKASLSILKSLRDEEAECILNCGDIPKYDMPAHDWLKEVKSFQSQRLQSYFLGGPMVFRFGEESPDAALDYILSLPKQTWNKQLGYQLIGSVIRSKRFSWAESLEWIETKMPHEIRSHEHYGLLASYWSQQDNASFQTWFQSLTDPDICDEVIIGFTRERQPQDWPEIIKLANKITDQTKRQAQVAWVLDCWKNTDPEVALAQLENADISKEKRAQLQRDIAARLAQVANAKDNL